MANPYLQHAERAIQAAEANPHPLEAGPVDQVINHVSPLARFSDNDLARFNSPYPPRQASSIYVPPQKECLYLAFAAVDEVLGYTLRDKSVVDYFIEHESQHRDVARRLNIPRGEFGVNLTKYTKDCGDDVWGTHAFFNGIDFRTTKLGAALILVYPSEPSMGDLEAIREMGYRDTEDVARRVSKRNKRLQGSLYDLYPMPLSMAS